MRAEEIRSVLAENPHRSAWLHLTSGRSVLVQAFDYIFFPPGSQTIVVAVPEGGFAIIDCATVSEIRTQPRPRKKSKT